MTAVTLAATASPIVTTSTRVRTAPTIWPASAQRRSERRAGGATRPPPGTVNLWDEYEKWKRENPEGLQRALRGGLIGSPETIRNKLRRFETSHIDQIILLNQAGNNTHEHICESLDLFAREVMPEFHANILEQDAWKAKVLTGEIELEEIDTKPFRDRYGPNSVQLRPAIGPQAAE